MTFQLKKLTQKNNDVEMDGIKSSLHDVTESFNKLSAKVTETETAQKSGNTTLLTMMAEMKVEIDSLKTEITELKKDSLPKPIVTNSTVGTTATNNLTNVITLYLTATASLSAACSKSI